MTPNEYLNKVLAQQTFDNDDDELRELRTERQRIESKLRAHFSSSSPSVRWGGSMAKETMICESYDGDMTCYFAHEDIGAGSTLEEIYNNTAATLEEAYLVERKASAIRVKDKVLVTDKHIDVVPGRFTDDSKNDVFLHRTTGDKQRLKTNLQTHIDHIRDSGVTDAIRLMKLWKVRNGLSIKTFVLELLVIELLTRRQRAGLSDQLLHVWTEMRDDADSLRAEDPANPTGNDLTPLMDQVRGELEMVARTTLATIDSQGWEAVFGELKDSEESASSTVRVLTAAAARTTSPTRPWLSGE